MKETRKQLISATALAIQEKGYYGTGITEIINKVGVPKGSLYHHFSKGKDQLVEESLFFSAHERALIFKEAMKGKENAVEGLKAVIDVFINEKDEQQRIMGCPLAVVSLEIALKNEEMRKVCAELYNFWQNGIADYLKYKNVSNAAEKAEKFFILLEGALLFARVHQSTRTLELVKKDIQNIINE